MKNKSVKFVRELGIELRRIRKYELGVGRDVIASGTGLDIVYVQLIERGKKEISLETALKFAKALGISILSFEGFLKKDN